MEHFECLVTWPTDRSAGDLMADYVRPQHRCTLPASHVNTSDGVQRSAVAGEQLPPMSVVPHRCHCGSWTPVRDAETEGELAR